MNYPRKPQLFVPQMAALADMNICEVSTCLEQHGVKAWIDIINWPQDFPCAPAAAVSLAHDGQMLYMRFDITGEDKKARYVHDNDAVWEDSAVEFFCCREGEPTYRNFEFNCIGTALAATRAGRDVDVHHLPEEQMQRIKRHASSGTQPFDEMSGLQTWHLCVGLPLDMLGVKTTPCLLRCNFYKCADMTAHPHYLSWNPIVLPKPDFHCPQFFGHMMLM